MNKKILKFFLIFSLFIILFFVFFLSKNRNLICQIIPNSEAYIPDENKIIKLYKDEGKIEFCLNEVINDDLYKQSQKITKINIYFTGILKNELKYPLNLNQKIKINRDEKLNKLGNDVNILFYSDNSVTKDITFFIDDTTIEFPKVKISQDTINEIINKNTDAINISTHQRDSIYTLAQNIIYIPLSDFEGKKITEVLYDPHQKDEKIIIKLQTNGKISLLKQENLTGPHIWVKFDSSFDNYSFFWDDMIVSWINYLFFPEIAKSTLDYWYLFQVTDDEQSGLIPRQTRPHQLKKILEEKRIKSNDILKYSAHHYISPQINNPFLMAEVEWELYKKSGDKERIKKVLPNLINYYNWIEENKTIETDDTNCSPLYITSTIATGADNNTQGISDLSGLYISYELISQQQILAKKISEIAQETDQEEIQNYFQLKSNELIKKIKKCHYSHDEKFFFNLKKDSVLQIIPHYSSAFIWGIYSDALTTEEVKIIINKWLSADQFGGQIILPSLPRSDDQFSAEGDYWRGGVWPPHWWIFLKSLEKHQLFEEYLYYENKIFNVLDTIYQTNKTQYEYLSPTLDDNNMPQAGHSLLGIYDAKENFYGWGSIYQGLIIRRHLK